MNFPRASRSFLFLFLIFPCLAIAQTPAGRFVNGESGFSIGLPPKPTASEKRDSTILGYDVFGETITWSDMPGTFAAVEIYHVYGEVPRLKPAEKVKIIAEHQKDIVASYKSRGIMIQETTFALDGITGSEIRGVKTGSLVVRMFFVRNHFIILSISRSAGSDFTSQLAILNTFHVLTKDEYIAARIAECPPKPLPQKPPQTRVINDWDRENLKGKVSRVVEANQETSRSAKELSGDSGYDRDGYLTNQILYMKGFPNQISVWGWIDGMRVNNEEYISYDDGEGPNEKQLTMITSMGSPEAAPKKRDERYGFRYEYTADAAGRPTGKKVFFNTGDLSWKESVTYGANTKTTVTSGDEGMRGREVDTLDAAGNVIEEKYFSPEGKLEWHSVYRYEFDAKGNWTVRRKFEKKIIKGKTQLIPGWIDYREITYYE